MHKLLPFVHRTQEFVEVNHPRRIQVCLAEHGGNLLLCVRCARDGTEFVHHHCEFVQIKHSVGVCVKVAKQSGGLIEFSGRE